MKMSGSVASLWGRRVLRHADLDLLLRALADEGRTVIGPRRTSDTLGIGEVHGVADLPDGWTDDQGPGRYRLRRDPDAGLFSYNLGPDSYKRYLFPPRQVLFRSKRTGDDVVIDAAPEPSVRYAFLGVRACDLAAIAVQDRVLRDGAPADPAYARRRADVFIVAVQCDRAASTCFCPSMGTGPRVSSGFDLALTELTASERCFVVEVGSEAGAALVARLPTREPGDEHDAPERAAAQAHARITKHLDTQDLPSKLKAAVTGPHWDKVAERCLGCANCTMVCPTCFCTTVSDLASLDGTAERVRTWDSCFHTSFTFTAGASARPSLGARYRQWLTHKLSSWWDQFGTSGCVGCGRCTTWCPAGIDLVAEAAAAASTPGDP